MLRVFEIGHVPDTRDIIRESNAWLDRYLGPVRRGHTAEAAPADDR